MGLQPRRGCIRTAFPTVSFNPRSQQHQRISITEDGKDLKRLDILILAFLIWLRKEERKGWIETSPLPPLGLCYVSSAR